MGILTETCAAAVAAYGIFTSGGEPIGRDLLSQEAISFAIIDDNSEVSDSLQSTLSSHFYFKTLIDRAAPLPDTIQVEDIKKSLSIWTDAEFKEVEPGENPDFLIYTYRKADFDADGSALLTQNDQTRFMSYSDVPVIAVNGQASILDIFDAVEAGIEELPENAPANRILQTTAHEFGHAVAGIMHPKDAVKDFVETEENDLQYCTLNELKYLYDETQGHVMSYSRSTTLGIYEEQAMRIVLGINGP